MAANDRFAAVLAFLRELWPDDLPPDKELVGFQLESRRHKRWGRVALAALALAVGVFEYVSCAAMPAGGSGRHADDAAAIPGVWLDLDLKEGQHAETRLPTLAEALIFIARLPLQPTLVLHSGGGLYVWWLFREPWVFDEPGERERAASLVAGWQAFVLDLARACGWELDNTSSLAQTLRAEGTLNAKYEPARPVYRIKEAGPRWNPCEIGEWVVSQTASITASGDSTRATLPEELPEWLATAVSGLNCGTAERRKDGRLAAVVLAVCPACEGRQQTVRGIARETAHISPLSGALRCKRQSCDARHSSGGGGISFADWTQRFLPAELVEQVLALRAECDEPLHWTVEPAASDPEGVDTVEIAEADQGALQALVDRAVQFARTQGGIAHVVVPLGAGKTRAVIDALARSRSAYFAPNHKLLLEVARELDARGIQYVHVKGVGRACHFREAFELYGSRPDWRGTACKKCVHRNDGSCDAWKPIPQDAVILAPHASYAVLRQMHRMPGVAGIVPSPLHGRLLVFDEGVSAVEVIKFQRNRVRAPLECPGAFRTHAENVEVGSSVLEALLTRAHRERVQTQNAAPSTRYFGAALRGLCAQELACRNRARVQTALSELILISPKKWPRPDGESLRNKRLNPDHVAHPDLLRLWLAFNELLQAEEQQCTPEGHVHGHLEIVASDNSATFELRTPRSLHLEDDNGAIILDATGHITRAELVAANPDVHVEDFVLNILPNPNARIVRVHVRTKNATRRRLIVEGACSKRALRMLRNALRFVAEHVGEHLAPAPHRCGLLTYKPISDALVSDAASLASVVPPALRLPAELVGYFGRDERGTNLFRGVTVLVTFGDPIANIGATAADARVLGLDPQALIDSRIQANLVQAQGRSRALRADGAVMLVHIGRVRPWAWAESLTCALPRGRPPADGRARAQRIVCRLLRSDNIVAVPIVAAILGRESGASEGLATIAYRDLLVGNFGHTPPGARRTLTRWVLDAAKREGAISSRVALPDGAWTTWRPPAMGPEEAAMRSRRAWEALRHSSDSDGGLAEDGAREPASTDVSDQTRDSAMPMARSLAFRCRIKPNALDALLRSAPINGEPAATCLAFRDPRLWQSSDGRTWSCAACQAEAVLKDNTTEREDGDERRA